MARAPTEDTVADARRAASTRAWWLAVVAVLTIASTLAVGYRQLERARSSGRAHATARLLAATTAPRVMDAPGVEAWLRDELERAVEHLPGPAQLTTRRLLDPGDASELPSFGPSLTKLLAMAPASSVTTDSDLPDPPRHEQDDDSLALRHVFTHSGEHPVVVTRRRRLEDMPASDSFVALSAKTLHGLADRWLDHKTGDVRTSFAPWLRGWTMSRLYTVSEDGTFVSLPIGRGVQDHREQLGNRLREEMSECRARPHSPHFVTMVFMFDLVGRSIATGTPHYSGMYLDIAGSGFVGTIVAPITDPATGIRGALAADVAFDIDLAQLLAPREHGLETAIADDVPDTGDGRWQPWSALRNRLPPSAPPDTRHAIVHLSEQEHREHSNSARRPIHHHVDHASGETVFALQIAAHRWLIARVPPPDATSAWLDFGLLALASLLAVGSIEAQRRRAASRWSRLTRAMQAVELPIDPPALPPALDDRLATTRQDERERLAAVLSHGADTLARVLASELEAPPDDARVRFCRWLSEYLVRRIHVTQWALAHWDRPPHQAMLASVEASHVVATATAYADLCRLVRQRPKLRQRLHWTNGLLAAPPRDPHADIVLVDSDWPSDVLIALPEEGVFGFVLGEVLVNAIKHGAPGASIVVTLRFDPARHDIVVRVCNELDLTRAPARPRAYGGLAIARRIAELCGWSGFSTSGEDDMFCVSWACPGVRRRESGSID